MPNAKKILIKNLPKFEAEVYTNLSFGDLVLFALSYLEEKELEASTEEIVSICFRLFPQKFGLKSYPRWPDSALVIRRVNDVREKKLMKGNASDGFGLTFKGKQVAKRVAKLLGIKKKDEPKKKKQKPAALVLTKKTLRRRVRKPLHTKFVKKKVIRRAAKNTKPIVKKPIRSKPVKKKVVRPAKKKITKSVIKKSHKKIMLKQKSKPKQLTMASITPAPVKKKAEVKKQVEVKKEAVIVAQVESVVNISKEEKIKAGRVIHQIEKSDAYKLYKKNGKQAKISEFDFRNMLFATMESSADTLTRNVALFKKYANIQSRNDVITFLNFCEEFFAKLLKKR